MQTEHLTNLHPGWVVGGWLIAVAVTAALYLGGIGLGVVMPDAATAWVVLSMAAGFYVGGLFVGLRWMDAPILHGAAISLFSVVVWFAATVLGRLEIFEEAGTVLGLILVQLVSSILGGSMGRRVSLGRAARD